MKRKIMIGVLSGLFALACHGAATSAVVTAAEGRNSGAIAPYRPPAKVSPYGIGWRGDGSGYYPDSKPPVEWDETTGKNILWKAPMPNWGYGCPVPVGNRVFVMSEGGWKCEWPELLCLDADTGKEVWRREINPLDAYPDLGAEERASLQADVSWILAYVRHRYRILGEYIFSDAADKGPDSDVFKKTVEALKAHGWGPNRKKANQDDYGDLVKLLPGKLIGGWGLVDPAGEGKERWDTVLKRLDQSLSIDILGQYWYVGAARMGATFPTPVSDGKRVFVTTGHGFVVCYDMDGNRLWMRGNPRSYGVKSSGMDNIASPRLYRDLLLVQWGGAKSNPATVVAYDVNTGQVKWLTQTHKRKIREHVFGQMVVMTAPSEQPGQPGVPIVVNGTSCVRLPDGFLYPTNLPSANEFTAYAIDESKGVLAYCTWEGNNSGVGFRLSIRNGDLAVTELFKIPHRPPQGWVMGDGVMFANGTRIDPTNGLFWDPQSGRGFSGPKGQQSGPGTAWLLLVAGGHVYGLGYEAGPPHIEGKVGRPYLGIAQVYDHSCKRVARNVMHPVWPWTGETREKWLSQGCYESYYMYDVRGHFSYSCPMNIGGDRLYIRGDDFLYCVAETGGEGAEGGGTK